MKYIVIHGGFSIVIRLVWGEHFFQKTKAIITRRQVDHPSCHWLFHQFFGASSRLMTRMARPRVRFTWSLSKSGGKTGHFFKKKSSWNMARSPPPPINKRTVKISSDFFANSGVPICSQVVVRKDIIPGSKADFQCRWLKMFWQRY